MNKIPFDIKGGKNYGSHDAAILLEGDDPMEALAAAVVDNLATKVMVTVGPYEVFLGMLMEPDHWADDWTELGVEDPHAFIAGLAEAQT